MTDTASNEITWIHPAQPYHVYANDGWAGTGDWLGTGQTADQLREYRPFKKARAFVRTLNLKSVTEWRGYCKSGKKPADIPAKPYRTFAKKGWGRNGRLAWDRQPSWQLAAFQESPQFRGWSQFEIGSRMARIF